MREDLWGIARMLASKRMILSPLWLALSLSPSHTMPSMLSLIFQMQLRRYIVV